MSSFIAVDLVNAKIEAINEFMTRMSEKFEIDDSIAELANEFKEELENDKTTELTKAKKANSGEKKVRKPRMKKTEGNNDGEDKVVKKRGPSMYNIFVKEHMIMFKSVSSKSRMAEIGIFWKTSSKGRFFADRQKEIKLTNSTLNSQEIYDMISKEWKNTMSSGEGSSSGEDTEVNEA